MSHELRTPLQSIAGYIDLLRVGAATPPTPEQARLLARVHDSEEVLVHVIDDLITFSRLEAGHVSYQIAPVSAAEAIRIAHSVVAPLAASHDVSLETSTCSGLFVSADGDKLKQILVNLAANAVKFCGTGGVVRISCQRDADSVCFDVSDNGPGNSRRPARRHLRAVRPTRDTGLRGIRRHRSRPRDQPRVRHGHARAAHGGEQSRTGIGVLAKDSQRRVARGHGRDDRRERAGRRGAPALADTTPAA